jgi:hypothetical protein
MNEREESDQLPEEAPSEQVSDDDGQGDRDDAEKDAGAAENPGQATGHPDNAG